MVPIMTVQGTRHKTLYAIAKEKFFDIAKARISISKNYQFSNLVYVNLIRQNTGKLYPIY